jgi:hypothetical protein
MKIKEKHDNLIYLIISFIFSLTTIFVISGLRIINPRNTGWLVIGDGEMEIAWEFFRYQPIFQIPLGLNPKYGLETSTTIAFDTQIPIMSLILHPLSPVLGERFQYLGIFLLFTFALNFYFASKIFQYLNLTKYQVVINSTIISLSPIILNRFIENTHYTLTSAWLILWAIYLNLNNNKNTIQWLALFNLVVLIHFYYMLFVLTIFIINRIFNIYQKRELMRSYSKQFLLILTSILINMYLIGYFYGNVDSASVGYGNLAATFLSPFDPSGWSTFIVDLPEIPGAYEGFSYVGTSTILLLIAYIFLFKKKIRNEDIWQKSNLSIWISATLLFLFSLSNKIYFGTVKLIEIPLPESLLQLFATFRSTGRFTWLFVFVLFIWLTYKVSLKMDSKHYSIILSLILVTTLIDYWPKLNSEKQNNFNATYQSNLISPAWKELNECYKNIRVYPPILGVDNFYNFLNVAYPQKMGINTGRLGRFDQDTMKNSLKELNEQFKIGKLDRDSFYIFTTSEFFDENIINFYKNISLKTINENTGWGELDGYTYLAPELKNCRGANNLKNVVYEFGPKDDFIYKGGIIYFGTDKQSNNYILSEVALNQENFETVNNRGNIILNVDKNLNYSKIKINHDQSLLDEKSYKITINDISKDCIFTIDNKSCTVDLSSVNDRRILVIQIEPYDNLETTLSSELRIESLEVS